MNPSPFPDWREQTVVILASGPSLVVPNLPSTVRTITTNTTHEKLPTADVHFAVDHLWWKLNWSKVKNKAACWTQDRMSAERYGIKWVRQEARPGLGQKGLRVNGCSGFGAINLAYLFGARRILLLGFDMKLGPNGQRHWHGDHPAPCVQALQFKEWLHKSVLLARELREAGCSVINCTHGSAMTAFPTSTIEKELPCP